MLLQLNRECTLVLVTHNPQLAALADREIRLKDGRIHEIVVHKKNGAKPGAKIRKGAGVAKKAGKKIAKKAAKKSARRSNAKKIPARGGRGGKA